MAAKFWSVIWRLVKRYWVDVAFLASAPVPSSSQQKKQTHCLQRVLQGEDFMNSSASEVGVTDLSPGRTIVKESGMVSMECLFLVSQPNLSALEQSRLHE